MTSLDFGPLAPFMQDDTVTGIVITGFQRVFVRQSSGLQPAGITFESDEHLRRVLETLLTSAGQHLEAGAPLLETLLPDRTRLYAAFPPVAPRGMAVMLHKFPARALTIEDMIRFNVLTPGVADFLLACVTAKINMVVCGGTSSGKTTFLNVLAEFIPAQEQVVVVERAGEWPGQRDSFVLLQARRPDAEGRGEITPRDLVQSGLAMSPDRIIMTEVLGGEALDVFQAMNNGFSGSMTSIHAVGPRDALKRLELMCAGADGPGRVIRDQLASSVELIVDIQRQRDGSRKVMRITEVQGMSGDTIVLADLFEFGANHLRGTGLRPLFMDRLLETGIELPRDLFSKTHQA